MLKLKNAVNSFVLTKKKFDKKKNKKKTRRMRGGVFGFGKKTPEQQQQIEQQKQDKKKREQNIIYQKKGEKILNALKKAINNDYTHCLDGLDKALANETKPDSKIIFHKAKIHIPVVRENLNKVEDVIKKFTENTKLRDSLIEDIKKKKDDLDIKYRALTEINLEDKDVPQGIKQVYKGESIEDASEVSNILKLIVLNAEGEISEIHEEKISEKATESNNKYKYFLGLVETARKSNPRVTKSMMSGFSFGTKSATKPDASVPVEPPPASGPPPPPAPVPKAVNPPLVPASRPVNPPPPPKAAEAVKSGSSVGQREFTVTTEAGCTPKSCKALITQKGGSRKSKRSKTLKGGRRRR